MTSYYLLVIPIAIGILAGGFLAFYPEPEKSTTNLTPSKLIENDSPESTEWLTAHMLLARERGESNVQKTLIQELIKRQHHDGGWGWLSSEQSDALGTGMALYALKRSSYPESSYDPSAIRARAARATHYLTETQEPNGSWIVMGTKNKTRNRPTETATFWGTAWAVIALLQD